MLGHALRTLGPSPSLCLDVGSFDGKNAIAFVRKGCSSVYAFEPTPSKIKRIRTTLKRSKMEQNVTLFEMAAGNVTGTTSFWLSAVEGSKDRDAGSEQDQLDRPQWGAAKEVKVRVDTLDQVVGSSAVAYAKIDAQGHDPEVIFGAERLLRSGLLRRFSFEVWPQQRRGGPGGSAAEYVRAVSWLAERGFKCFDCGGHGADHRPFNGRAEHLMRNLSSFMHRGVSVPGFTNLVCLASG